jgi:tetratricopeptide (TPR) repeat protein
LDINNPDAYFYRAIGKQFKMQYDSAMADFNKAILLNPKDARMYLGRGRNRADMKDMKGAIEDFDYAIRLDSMNSYAYFNRAIAKCQTNDSIGALKDYDKVLKLDPENALTYFNRAELKEKFGDLYGSIEDYNHAEEISPNNVFTFFNRAIVWYRLKNYHNAIKDNTSAINLNPVFATAYYNRSIARRNINDYRGSENDYKTAIKINSKLDSLTQAGRIDSTGLAKLTEFKADFEEGNKRNTKDSAAGMLPFRNFNIFYNLKDTIKIEPNPNIEKIKELNKEINSHYQFNISCTDDSLTQENAAQLLKSLVEMPNPLDNDMMIFERAILKYKLQDFNGSIDEYNTLINLKPELSYAYFNRANTRYEMISFMNALNSYNNNVIFIGNYNIKAQSDKKTNLQNYDDVVADYQKCIQLNPWFNYAYFNLANINIDSKDFLSAITNLTKAIEIEPKFAEAYYNRGLTYIYVQKKEEGCTDLSKAGELGVQRAYEVIKKFCNQ